eukprot:CAMPEP_0201551952 /NCGR_PEP_ID=MMETSP0173_2-20130828/12161_1 /ASSEMBLY_ACC=CAM_ASM_000268 /TAXON_ID=218659 /ORGANISM="Vexillifera sp., Strain DIVA3 564/2" /LENGTH=234 /DNA_ID=CAMNT_0047962327 /DNA_START=101 /DNA_END=801 /DNA_ORIENTATION=+
MATRKQSTLAKLYLIFYNLLQFGGWSFLLYQVVLHFALTKDSQSLSEKFDSLYENVATTLLFFQGLAFLEILHARGVLGLVPSPLGTTLMQVFSRLNMVFVCAQIVAARSHPFFTTMVLAWTVTEIIRYLYYALSTAGQSLVVLTYLRYTLFYVLYPLGVFSELSCLWYAAPAVRHQSKPFVSMHFLDDYKQVFLIFQFLFIVGYLPGFPTLYNYMRKQRKIQKANDWGNAKKT